MTGQRRDAGDLRTTLASNFILFLSEKAMCAHFKAEKASKAMKGQGSCPSYMPSSLFLPLRQPLAPVSALLGFFSRVAYHEQSRH